MTPRLALLCLVALFGLATIGCDKQRDALLVEDMSSSQVNWAVLVYVSGNYAGDILQEPIEGSLSRAISTVRVLEKTESPEIVETYVCIASSETNGEVGIYKVSYSGRIPETLFDAQLIRNLGAVSMADPMTLETFTSIVLDESSARHYMLALSGDGIGWRGVLGDNIRPEGMSLLNLHTAIDHASAFLPTNRFDVLCLYARNMGTVETVAQLSDHADYIMASPWRFEQPHSLIINEWYRDLSSQPQLSPEDLGAYVIDAERLAQDSSTTEYFSTLWKSDRIGPVEAAFEAFASQWAAVAPEHAAEVTNLRNEATDEGYYNSNFIDLARYAELIESSPAFEDESFDALRASASELQSKISDACIARFGSSASLRYGGLNLYFPTGEVDSALSSSYGNLDISTSAPSWAGVIDSLASRGNSTVTITGQAYWPGRSFHDVIFIVDTTSSSAIDPLYFGTPEWSVSSTAGDTISYSATIDLQSLDSLNIKQFLLVIDRDQDGNLNSGDSLGFWNDGVSPFTAFTVHRGTTDADRNVLINRRR
ncbi:MAG: hypothetical protein H6508_08375 [Calditrichaeota bacterium]|nr:hypothetical protein [Calditrichota bacterium]MCB9367179.1 hypothetical protein [Calditrichota bacterium]